VEAGATCFSFSYFPNPVIEKVLGPAVTWNTIEDYRNRHA
jgi:hypothetical protein